MSIYFVAADPLVDGGLAEAYGLSQARPVQLFSSSETPMENEVDRDAIPSFEFRDSRAAYAAVGVVAGAASLVCSVLGWLPVALVPAGIAAWAAVRMASGSIPLRITEEGVEDRSFWYSPGLIEWSEILEIREGPWGAVEIDLRDEAGFWEKLGPLQRLRRMKLQLFYGLGPAAIIPWMLRSSRREIVLRLQEGLDTFALRELTEQSRLERARLPGPSERS